MSDVYFSVSSHTEGSWKSSPQASDFIGASVSYVLKLSLAACRGHTLTFTPRVLMSFDNLAQLSSQQLLGKETVQGTGGIRRVL